MKTLLVAAGLLVGQSVWAGDVTTLYERGTTTSWSDADLTDWVASGVTPTIDGGLKIATYNTAWTTTKTISPTTNAIVTLNASITGVVANGNNNSYDYIQIGGVAFRLYGQAQTAKMVIDGVETELATKIARKSTYTIKIIVNTATNEVTYSYNGGDDVLSASTTAISNIVLGHYRGGSEATTWGTFDVNLNSITVTNETQDVATADYTLRYVAGGSTIKEETKNGTVGTAPVLSASEKANFTKDDVTYIYDNDDASSTTIVAGGTSVVTLNYHAAATYSYTVKSSLGTTLLSSTGLEASSVAYKYPQYILSGTDLYEAAKQGSNPWYGKTFTLTKDNQEETITYTKAVENVVYYSEAEKIDGASPKSGSNADIRCSNGEGAAFESNTTITTLPAGKYVIKGQVWGNKAITFNILAGTEKVWTLTTNGNLTPAASADFIVSTSADIIIEAAGDNGKMLDWVYIQKTGEATVSTTISSVGYATFSSTSALDFTNVDNAKAYIVTGKNGNSITTQQVEGKVAANTGLILKSNDGGEATVTIPVTTEEGTTYNTESDPKNYLFAVASNYDLGQPNSGTNYVLSVQNGKVVFAPIGSTVAPVKAGQAALWLDAELASTAKALSLVFGDDVTAINAVSNIERQASETYYNLQGQRVSEPKQGIYVVNGKKVLVK